MKRWILKHTNLFYLLHALAWVMYSLGLYVYNLVFSTQPNIFHAFAMTLLLALVFYILVAIFSLLISRRYWWLGIIVLVSFFIFINYFAYSYVYQILPKVNVKLFREDVDFDKKEFVKKVFDYFINFVVYAVVYTLARKYYKILRQKSADEAAFLRLQIYPHFQQNIMQSFIHEAKVTGNQSFAGRISILSDLMAYAFESTDSRRDRVYIKREIDYVEKMIRLIRDRAGNDEVVMYEREGDTGVAKIPPLTLLTFVENAVKYGDFTRDDPLFIRMSFSDNQFVFYCQNWIASRAVGTDSFKLGIPNTVQRLKAFFGKRYQLSFFEEAGYYAVRLSIEI